MISYGLAQKAVAGVQMVTQEMGKRWDDGRNNDVQIAKCDLVGLVDSPRVAHSVLAPLVLRSYSKIALRAPLTPKKCR